MTDEEKIIMDGVNVSGCEFYQMVFEKPDRHDPCNQWGDLKLIFCSEKANCHFKQSARKDERIKKLEQLNAQLAFKLEKLAHENGELKYFQHIKTKYNAIVEHNKYLQSELLITRSKVDRKTYDIYKIHAELEKLKQKLSLIVHLCDEIEQRDFNCTSNIDCDTCELNEACNEAFQQDREIYFKKAQQIKQTAQEE